MTRSVWDVLGGPQRRNPLMNFFVLFGAVGGLGGEMPVHCTHYDVCRCHYLYRHPRVSYVCVCVRVCVVHPRTLVVARITVREN